MLRQQPDAIRLPPAAGAGRTVKRSLSPASQRLPSFEL